MIRNLKYILRLMSRTSSALGKFEVLAAAIRTLPYYLRGEQGAFHVRRKLVVDCCGHEFVVPPFDATVLDLFLDRHYENYINSTSTAKVEHRIVSELEKSTKPVCIDIGASIGNTTLFAAHLFPQRSFFCVEPLPWLAAALRESVQRQALRNVAILEFALSGPSRTSSIVLNVPTCRGTRISEISSVHSHAEPGVLQVACQARTLDELLSENNIAPSDIALIKMDVEGAELEVLKGAAKTLGASPVPVLFEARTPPHFEECEKLLRSLGYGSFDPVDEINFLAR